MSKKKTKSVRGFALVKNCHKKPTVAFRVGKTTVYATTVYNMDEAGSNDLVVSLTGNLPSGVQVGGILRSADDPHILVLDWEDHKGFPIWGRKSWEVLAKSLQRYEKVYIGCVGGHGRTGTVIAILMHLLLDITDPVKEVRKKVCSRCIESNEQVEYIAKITGLDLSRYLAPNNVTLLPKDIEFLKRKEGLYGSYSTKFGWEW